MANALQVKIDHLLSRVRNGSVGKFFAWWGEELKLALPEDWQQKLRQGTRRATLQPAGGELEVGLDESHALRSLGRFPDTQDPGVQRQQVRDVLVENGLEEPVFFLLLDSGRVLSREVKLPSAAEANLRQVLTFEMDRQTPFKASAVYFDWNVLERGGSGGQLRLMLYVVPRDEVDEAVRRVRDRGFQLSGVDVRENGSALGLNLLPEEDRHRRVNQKARLNWALGGIALLLLMLVMATSLTLREHQVGELDEAIAEVRGEAMQVDRVKKQIDGAAEAAGFLATRRAATPMVVALLADITRILPDDTYLDRLVIGRSNVQMQGKSSNAQRLIELVNESPYMGAASFRGSTRLDARTGLEIFEINAQVKAEDEDGADS